MDHNNPASQRPHKKRRTNKGRLPILREGDDLTADGSILYPVMVDTEEGPVEGFERRHVWLDQEQGLTGTGAAAASATGQSAPAVHENEDYLHANRDNLDAQFGEEIPSRINRRSQHDYLQQFVDTGTGASHAGCPAFT